MAGPLSIAVLGGGISGLAAAWKLSRRGHRVRLFEAADRVGGAIKTESENGWLVETGPHSFQEKFPELRALWSELGLEEERVEAGPAARHRYLARGGRLIPLPASPGGLFGSRLLSARAKARVLSELFFRPRARDGDVSVGEFMRDHFGREIVDRIVQPFVSGIFAGDPERLSARQAFPAWWEIERNRGSLLRGQIAAARTRRARGETGAPAIISFRRGLRTLPAAFVAQMLPETLVLNARVGAIRPSASAPPTLSPPGTAQSAPLPPPRWRVEWQRGGGDFAEAFDAVLCTLPAWAAAELEIGPTGQHPLSGLTAIEHPPVASLFLGFRREQVRHPLDGFGTLIPAAERRPSLGFIFDSSLFPNRAPEGHVALTVLAGGALSPELAGLSAAELRAAVAPDLRDLLGVEGEPGFLRHHAWRRAIPQYNLGYENHRERWRACERDHPGLWFGGNARDGISLPDCLRSGLSLADQVETTPLFDAA